MNLTKTLLIMLIFCFSSTIIGNSTNQEAFLKVKGPYLGQKAPGEVPQIFAPGIVSTDKGELNIIISPDGMEIYFSRSPSPQPTVIMVIKQDKGRWTEPRVASFSGTYSDMDPGMSPDGKQVFFGSTRPTGNENAVGCDIWVVRRLSQGEWSKPKNIGAPVNTLQNENYPTITRTGTLYFQSKGHGGTGGLDIFCSTFKDGGYQKPKNLGKAINSKYNDYDAFIAPDESYLIFSSSNRPNGLGSGDLYISFHKKDGSWTKAENLGSTINSTSIDYCPKVSPDGKYFFFTSRRTGNGDIYWVDAQVLKRHKS
jgi:Tol biopolymer transport system component